MALTGIPGYTSPSFQSLRCPCGIRYVVLVGSEDNKQNAMAEAETINADFVDARRILTFQCFCGLDIDISTDVSLTVQ